MWDVSEIKKQFSEKGYAGALPLFTAQQCREFLDAVSGENIRAPLDWEKGFACSSRSYYEVATHPDILKVVSAILGNDVILWGCSLLARRPGFVHPWHSDIESIGGKTISVWIGLQNTTSESSLQMIARSHTFGRCIQEVRHNHGMTRENTKTENVLEWSYRFDPESSLVCPAMSDGAVLFFHGNLWHGSNNLTKETRKALLLQYATAETPIRIPDPNHVDWPIRRLDMPKPPCLLVLGSASDNVNRIVNAPVPSGTGKQAQLSSCVYPLQLPLAPDEEKGWKPYPIFRGCTSNLQSVSCHVSVLNHNCSPHPPHTHPEEEILLLLDGEVDLILPETPDQHLRLRCHEFVYYPSGFPHTLQTVSKNPATYLMLRWRNEKNGAGTRLPFGHFRMKDFAADVPYGKLKMKIFFEGATAHLNHLQCHASHLAAGGGYPPHVDSHDGAIIVLSGEVETLDYRVGTHGIIFYTAGQLHGMRNPGEVTAKYLVFEFSGGSPPFPQTSHKRRRTLLSKLADPHVWVRKAKKIMKRTIRV